MKTILIFLSVIICLMGVSCQSTNSELPPLSTIKPMAIASGDSLANEKLKYDTTTGCMIILRDKGYAINVNLEPKGIFVLQQPRGEVGERSWRENWVFFIDEDVISFIITFRETGIDSASFDIELMDSGTSPKSI